MFSAYAPSLPVSLRQTNKHTHQLCYEAEAQDLPEAFLLDTMAYIIIGMVFTSCFSTQVLWK